MIVVAGWSAIQSARYLGDPLAPTPVSAVSRKLHNGVPFDIDLPLTGRGVECRGAGSHRVVFTFASPVTVAGAAVQGSGSVDRYTNNGTAIAVDLSNVQDASNITVSLIGVSNGSASGNTSVALGVLSGDTNGDGIVNAGDALQTRNRAGQATDLTNFRADVNMDGFVNSGDSTIVRSRSGTSLP
ncbi:MAG: dockerin type I domain-containing protein [Verrucomicrobiota bacterium]|nr:dockerin type I domain-containing protein [Verrucomicrobiota bacterium]